MTLFRHVAFALRVVMEFVFTSVRLKVVVLILVTIQLQTGESNVIPQCVLAF